MVLNTLNLFLRFLKLKELKIENGQIIFAGENWTLSNITFFYLLQKYFEEKDEIWKLYLLYWLAGLIGIAKFVSRYKLSKPDDIYNWGMMLGEMLGLGCFKTHYYNWQAFTYVEIKNYPLLQYNLKIPELIIVASMAGGACLVHNSIVESYTVERNKDHVKFILGTIDYLKQNKYYEKIKDIYNLDIILPVQKEIYRIVVEEKDFSYEKIAQILSKVL